jgi:hypothetical protein
VNPPHPRHQRSIEGVFITNADYSFPYKQMRTALGRGFAHGGDIHFFVADDDGDGDF